MHPSAVPHIPAPTRTLAAIGLGSLLLLGACASTPPEPTVAMQAAQQAITTADRARIADQESPELHEARDKLAAAQTAVQEKKMVQAERLAQESRVDAELASATIEAAKARAVNDDMIRSDATLRQELQRKSGVAQ
jgi:putative cell wall-binding protein